MDRDLLSVLLIYPRIFLSIICIVSYSYYMFMCVSCFGVVVSTSHVIGYKDSSCLSVIRRLSQAAW